MAFCSKCGTSLSDDARFCSACGSPVAPAETVAQPGQTQAQAPQQSYYTQPQQSYYAQPQNTEPQQNYYAQQPQPPQQPQQSYYAQQQPGQYGYQQETSYESGPADIQENKGICVLCYLGILLLIPLLSKPNSAYVRYHSNQGLVLLIFEIVVGILFMIPYAGWFLIGPVGYIFSLVCLIMGIVNAASGNMKPLPLIGKISLFK